MVIASSAGTATTASAQQNTGQGSGGKGTYEDLVALFADWRAFERPPMRDGAPDYTAETTMRRHRELQDYQARLQAIDPSGWPVEQQIDWHIVRAEMNGMDFNIRILKPWERDPAWYAILWDAQSDTPDHEGPTGHAAIELWKYSWPLSKADEKKLTQQLRVIPPLLAQARLNLTGNARDLWISGTGSIRKQLPILDDVEKKTAKAGADLKRAIRDARQALTDFAAWLDQQAPSKKGPSGIGKDNYTWMLQNVYLIPLTWEDEVAILKRELARAHASLRLEEQRNRGQPEIVPAKDEAEYQKRANDSITKFMKFLEEKDIITIKPNMDPALRAQIGHWEPEEQRNFFSIATHLEPNTLYTHFYHWWDLAQMRDEPHPSPIRRGPLLYNIWHSRAEGMATAFEEMMMHAGLFDDQPRAREIQWIMFAQRCARGLGSLYAQSNDFTMKEAADMQVSWTPRGWMSPTLDLLGFEQQLYLRQPSYGTSYVIGKFLLEDLMKDLSKQRGDKFTLKGYFDDLNKAGMIPVSLIRWQLTGKDDQIRRMMGQTVKLETGAE